MTNIEKILEIATSVLGIQATSETSQVNCQGWTSLKTVQMIMALDEAGIAVPFEKIADIHSVQDVIDISGRA